MISGALLIDDFQAVAYRGHMRLTLTGWVAHRLPVALALPAPALAWRGQTSKRRRPSPRRRFALFRAVT